MTTSLKKKIEIIVLIFLRVLGSYSCLTFSLMLSGVLQEGFTVMLQKPSFYKELTQDARGEWQNRTGRTVLDYVKNLLVENVGKPLNNLIR